MSIRLRLTLLYTAILALTLIVFSAALYLTVQQVAKQAREEAKNALVNDTQRLVDGTGFKIEELDRLPAGKGKAIPPDTYVRALTLDGAEIGRGKTPDVPELALPNLTDAQLREAREKGETAVQTETIGTGQWLTYGKVVKERGKAVGIVQLARRAEDPGQALGTLRTVLIIGTIIVTVLAFGIGWLLSRFALSPIERITGAARTIGASRDFSRRVDYAGPQDEVGQLATTFNGMLAALQSAHEQTKDALQAQRRLVADASHELRTPLTTIRGNLGLLQRDPPIGADDRRAALADMVAETERMSRLVNDLLTLARADAGRPLAREPVPLAPLLDDLCRQARLLAPGREIDCATPAGALAALGDRDALRQVLLILLDNALKYTPASGAVGLDAAAEGEWVAVTVRDTGVGIAPADLPHLFERFYRSDTARTGGGAGLGLAIAKALTDAQGGRIVVESAPGVGSRFTVTLPRAADATPTPAPASPVGARAD